MALYISSTTNADFKVEAISVAHLIMEKKTWKSNLFGSTWADNVLIPVSKSRGKHYVAFESPDGTQRLTLRISGSILKALNKTDIRRNDILANPVYSSAAYELQKDDKGEFVRIAGTDRLVPVIKDGKKVPILDRNGNPLRFNVIGMKSTAATMGQLSEDDIKALEEQMAEFQKVGA